MEEEEKKKVSFLLFYDWEPLFEMLSREDRGDLISALFAYEKREELPEPSELSPQVLGLFDYLSKILDENKRQWQIRSLRGTKAGKASGEARRNKNEQNTNLNEQSGTNANKNEPKDKDKVKDKDKDKVSPNGDKEREYKRDSDKPNPSTPKPKPDRNKIPPDIEKVREYCQQRNSSVDPDYFFNYYEGQGWIKANGQKIKDWQATIRTWEDGNKAKGNTTTPTPTQPELTNEQIAMLACMDLQKGVSNGVHNNGYDYGNILPSIPESV